MGVISTRVAWLLDSLTKAFAYVDTTTHEDQSVGNVLAGYSDPHLPCATPSIQTLKELLPAVEFAQLLSFRGQLFKNVSGFTGVSLNVDAAVLDAVMASLLIHLEEVATAVAKEQAVSRVHIAIYVQFHAALEATNAALGSALTLTTCTSWGQQLRTAWEAENFAQLGGSSGGDTAGLAAAVTQMLFSIAAMQRTLTKLAATQERKDAQPVENPSPPQGAPAKTNSSNIIVEAHTLAGCFFNWFTQQMWQAATGKKQQFARADLKACINVMIIAAGMDITMPVQPTDRDGISHRLWKQSLWTLAEDVDKTTNEALGLLDTKGRCKIPGSLRKRWRKLRVENRSSFDALCSAYVLRNANGRIVDHCRPVTHQWQAKDFK